MPDCFASIYCCIPGQVVQNLKEDVLSPKFNVRLSGYSLDCYLQTNQWYPSYCAPGRNFLETPPHWPATISMYRHISHDTVEDINVIDSDCYVPISSARFNTLLEIWKMEVCRKPDAYYNNLSLLILIDTNICHFQNQCQTMILLWIHINNAGVNI